MAKGISGKDVKVKDKQALARSLQKNAKLNKPSDKSEVKREYKVVSKPKTLPKGFDDKKDKKIVFNHPKQGELYRDSGKGHWITTKTGKKLFIKD